MLTIVSNCVSNEAQINAFSLLNLSEQSLAKQLAPPAQFQAATAFSAWTNFMNARIVELHIFGRHLSLGTAFKAAPHLQWCAALLTSTFTNHIFFQTIFFRKISFK